MQWSFDLHSFEEQKRIADILSSLDAKIELNRQINDNLNPTYYA
ncbi:MAG: restriction endonuclease subunit S [Alistipes indistinctus]